jgi:TonB family protein
MRFGQILASFILAGSLQLVAQPGSSPPTPGNPSAPPSPAAEAAKTQESSPAPPASASPAKLPDSTKLEPLNTPKADYPIRAADEGIQGQVWLKISINEEGSVDGVEVISGHELLTEAAVTTVKKWKFRPFIKDGKPVRVTTKIPFSFAFKDKVTDVAPPVANEKTVGGDANKNPVKIPQGIAVGLLIHKVAPVYPESARMNRVQGTVVLQAQIDKDGRIAELKAISGPKELFPAAVGAVQQWRYRPYLLNGQPVAVATQVVVNFMLR